MKPARDEDDEDEKVEHLADPKTIAPALIELLKNEDEEEEMNFEAPLLMDTNTIRKIFRRKNRLLILNLTE